MSELSLVINKLSIVKQIPLFSKLNWFDMNFIVSKCSLFAYKKGELIYKEGDPPDAFYCLISGRLEAYTALDDGRKDILEYLHRGEYFGIISLLTGDNHSVSIRAINDSLLLKIERSDFDKIIRRIPNLSIELSQSVSRRLKRKDFHQKTIFESTIICVHSPITESGTSTYAVNLALSLKKETNRKVVLLNINSSTEEVLDRLRVSKDLPSADLKNITYENTKIVQQILSHEWGIDLLNVNYDPQDTAQKNQISLLLTFLSNDYHYIVVDLPNRMDEVVFKTLLESDLLHLIVMPQLESFKILEEILNRLRSELKDSFRQEKIKIITRQLNKDMSLESGVLSGFENYKIYATLPLLKPAYHDEIKSPEDIIVVITNPGCEYAKAVRRISRHVGKVLVGLVLGGGAALGLAHIGVIKVLEKENIPIDVVVGSSMGALIGAIWTSGRNSSEVEQIAESFKNKFLAFKLLDISFPISGLIRGRNIKRFLKKILGDRTFRDTNRTLKIVTYDLKKRQEVIREEGKLADAVMESCVIPGVLSPVLRDDMILIDGGVLNPVPTNVLTGMGIKKIIAVNVLHNPEDVIAGLNSAEERLEDERKIRFFRSPFRFIGFRIKMLLRKVFFPNIFDVIVNSFQAVEYVLAEEGCRHADITIHPELAGVNWYELFNVELLISNGEKETNKLLVEIKKLAIE